MAIKRVKEGLLYEPDDVRSAFFSVPFLIGLIIINLYGFVKFYLNDTLDPLWAVLIIIGLGVVLFLIYLNLFVSSFVIIKEKSIVGKNGLHITLGEIKFDEIDEIYSSKIIEFNIIIKGKNFNKFKFTTGVEPTADLFSEIFYRAIKCRRISLSKIRERYSDLLIYEKDENTTPWPLIDPDRGLKERDYHAWEEKIVTADEARLTKDSVEKIKEKKTRKKQQQEEFRKAQELEKGYIQEWNSEKKNESDNK